MSEKSKEADRRFYWRHRESRLEKAKKRQANMTEDQKEKRRKYAREWYRKKYARNPKFRKAEVERARRNRNVDQHED